ncbi:hypothetical protein ES703_23486 [subsurface metagenome]
MKNNKKSPLKKRPLHVAGQSLDELIQNYKVDGLMLLLILVILIVVIITAWLNWAFPSIIVEWLNLASHNTPITIIISIISLLGIIYCIFRIINLLKKIKSHTLGRNGERIVAEIFDNLRGQGYVVFHDLVAENEKFNIDHVILSTHGIFTVETKTFSKPSKGEIAFKDEKIIIGNINRGNDIIIQSESESKWLKSLLRKSTGKNYYVMPVIVFPGWFVQPMPEYLKKRIWILNPEALSSFINNEPKTIDESDMHLAAFHISRYIRMYN